MIAFLLALLLWVLGHGPTPAPMHGATVPAPASVAPEPAGLLPRPGVVPGESHTPAPAAPTVAATATAPTSWFPQTWTPVLTPPPAPTDLPPVGDGPELQGPYMCTDPVDCPHGG